MFRISARVRPASGRLAVAALLATLMCTAGVFVAPAAHAAPVTVGALKYATDNTTVPPSATVTGPVDVNATSVTIPDTITDGGVSYDVVAIADDAFYQVDITSVTIGNKVTHIGNYAFATTQLQTVVIPDSVISLGEASFYSSPLSSITLGDSVQEIGPGAFEATRLISVTFPASLTRLHDAVFYDTGNSPFLLRSVYFLGPPPTITQTGNYKSLGEGTNLTVYYEPAFAVDFNAAAWPYTLVATGPVAPLPALTFAVDSTTSPASARVTGLGDPTTTAVTIPSTTDIGGVTYPVTSIGDNAFMNTNLASVTLPTSLTAIGNNAFAASLLTSIVLPDGVHTIGNGAFAQTPLAALQLGTGLTTIGDGAFHRTRLTAVTIPDAVTSIGREAFSRSTLASLTLGNSVTSISEGAFHLTRLGSLVVPNSVTTIGPWAFGETPLTSVSLSNAVTTIGSSAFSATLLTTVSIPASVTHIGEGAFDTDVGGGQVSLTSVVFQGSAPTVTPRLGTSPALGDIGSFGDNPQVTVYYALPHAPDFNAGGNGLWMRYTTAPGTTVDYDLAGHGTAIPAITVIPGTTAPQPTDPTEAGFQFIGWFDSPSAATAFDFTSPLPNSPTVTLHARWASPASPTPLAPIAIAALPATGTDPAPLALAGTSLLAMGALIRALSRGVARRRP